MKRNKRGGSELKFSDESILTLYKEGLSDAEIGRKLGCCHTTVALRRYKYKLPKNFEYYSKVEKEKLIELHTEGYTTKQLSEFFRVDKRQISAKCIQYGLQPNLPQNEIKEVTKEEEQVILGLGLGDGCINKSFTGKYAGARLDYAHGLQQEDYARHKANLLKRFTASIKYRNQFHNKRKKRYYNITILGKASVALNPYYDMFYKEGKKIISTEIIDKIEGLGMAIWYMDDGTKASKGGYYLCTNGFQWDDVEKVCKAIKNKFDITCKVVSTSWKKQPMIYIGVKGGNAEKYENLIKPYIIPSMMYKIQKDGISSPKPPVDNGKPIAVYYKGDLLGKYKSVLDAAKVLGLGRNTIDGILKGNRKRRSYKTIDFEFQYISKLETSD